jgi:hypothetical protein
MKRSAPLTRKVPLRSSGKRMKQGRSTGTPTQDEAARMAAIKAGPCVACHQRGIRSWCPEVHHLLSGGRRIGHLATVGLCEWHHRAVIAWGCTGAEMRDHFGPSLNEGSKPFHAEFGSDAVLLGYQNALLENTQ